MFDASKFNPLEDGPMGDFIPPEWTGPHAGKRLAEAFQTLAGVPIKAHGAMVTAWPDYVRDAADEISDEGEQRQPQRRRFAPAEISHMEEAISWPSRILGGVPAQMRIVQLIAIARAFSRDDDELLRRQERLCQRRGWYLPTVLRQNRRGLQMVAWALNREGLQPW
ncbi:hypothetical protein BJ122_102238 [Rhodopseudomonas faecalis]|uniref:Uncharacterized protein n=1 Tax=Rhodopseudomonas faecalis TaxID=99655 RepID=A0A318TJG5_9BRAD|nr:hypothetical protein [Rhodopseudomonas faecalis]PYF05012.1 hypothetical protein BJ122_102238 [Rhodopseudomonas faecalis]